MLGYIYFMAESQTDEEIIKQYIDGDDEAFKELLNRYTKPLYNFVVHFVNKNDTPDVVSETFIKVWKNVNRFDADKASFKTWIFTIAKNSAMDFLRKKKSLLFSDIKSGEDEEINTFAENIPDESVLPDEALQKLQDKEVLNDILKDLPPHYQEVLILHYQEELTFDEIGKILDKPLNTVKSQHRRALFMMRQKLD